MGAGPGGAVDLGALAMRIQSIGLAQANQAFDQLDAKGAKAADTFTRVEAASGHAGHGIGRLQNTVTNAALAFGGLEGPIGRVADKFLGFSVGGGPTAIAAIAVGAIAFAFNQAGEGARQFTKDVDTLYASLIKLSNVDPLKEIRSQIGNAAGLLPEAQAKEKAGGNVTLGGAILESLFGDLGAYYQQKQSEARGERMKLEAGIKSGLSVTDPQLGGFSIPSIAGSVFDKARTPGRGVADSLAIATADQVKATNDAMNKLLGTTVSIAAPTRDYVQDLNDAMDATAASEKGTKALTKAEEDHARAVQLASAAVIQAAAQMVANIIAILQSSDNFFQKIGGIAMAIGSYVAIGNPILGAEIAGAGLVLNQLATPHDQSYKGYGNQYPGQYPRGGVPSSTGDSPAAAPAMGGNVYHITVIGEDDPRAQRQIMKLIGNGKARGL